MSRVNFNKKGLWDLWKPREDSNGEDNGQVTIIGGSGLFIGAPLLSLITVSRLVDMVFLATPEEDRTTANKARLFSKLKSVIWIPRSELDKYILKSDAVLIGPGMMRYQSESKRAEERGSIRIYDDAGTETKMLTHYLLGKHPDKRWVIDGGSLQVMEADRIPPGAILTPNKREIQLLFGTSPFPFPSPKSGEGSEVRCLEEMAKKYSCVIVGKGAVGYATDGQTTYEITGGNAGLTKGGTGDVLAGVIAGLAAKNEPLLAAAAGTYLVKKTAESLFERVGFAYNADDLAENVFEVYKNLIDSDK